MVSVILDVKTLFVADALVTSFIGLALLFYWKNNKTYPGFVLWILSNFFATIGYAAIFLRGFLPVWTSILLVNVTIVLACVMRLDGMMRFLQGKSLSRYYYAIPVISLVLAGYFYFAVDNFLIRLAFFTAWICMLIWAIAVVFIRSAPAESKSLHFTAGAISIIYGVIILVHTIIWIKNPAYGLFYNAGFHSLCLTSILIYEIWFGILIMMINNQRLGAELLTSETSLRSYIIRLETAISEVKVLKGLLPICASCKKIRDDQGYWNHLESYIDRHSEASFTHGICPDCAIKMRQEIEELNFPKREKPFPHQTDSFFAE